MATEKRKPGRPPGSKNRPKAPNPTVAVGAASTPASPSQAVGPTRVLDAQIRELKERQTYVSRAETGVVDDEKGWEALALLARNRFRQARMYRSTEALGDATTEQVLQRCYRQISGQHDPMTIEAVEASGVDLNLNLSELKVDAFEAWSRSILTDSPKLPFTIEPSDIPELSARAKEEVLAQLKFELFASGNPLPDDIVAFTRQLKGRQLEIERENAALAASNMFRLISDQFGDGRFRPALLSVIRDMAIYPYCVMEGPIPTVIDTLKWSGSRLIKSQQVTPVFRRRSPFDLFWTADSPDTQNGTAVFLREKMTMSNLIGAARMKSYIAKNIINAIDRYSGVAVDRDWLNHNPERPRTMIGEPWGTDQSIEVLTMYTKLSGDELRPYGYNLDGHLFFEAKVKSIGPYVIQAMVNSAPGPFSRPIYTATMTPLGDRIAGRGLCQKLFNTERAYHAALRGLIRNLHFSSGPIGEVDYSRIARWIADGDIGEVEPYTVYPVDPDMTGGGRPAHFFHNVPSVAGAMLQVMDFFSRQADRFSQIPSAFHGEAVGTGVNRTFRGVTLLQGNALKGIQAALTNLGTGIITPCVGNLYDQNMMYSTDESVKGDTRPKIADIAGLLEQEVAKQEAMERLQLVAQVAQAGAASPAAVSWATDEVLKAAGVPLEKLRSGPGSSGPAPAAPAAPAGPAPAGQQGGVAPPDQGIAAPDIGAV